MTEEPGKLQSIGLQKVRHDCLTKHSHMVAWPVKNLSAMQETQVQSLDQEDPLEEAVATNSSILAWRTP